MYAKEWDVKMASIDKFDAISKNYERVGESREKKVELLNNNKKFCDYMKKLLACFKGEKFIISSSCAK